MLNFYSCCWYLLWKKACADHEKYSIFSIDKIADIPVIMLTTEGQDEDRDKAISLGATAYIIKPFNPSQLLELLEEFLQP